MHAKIVALSALFTLVAAGGYGPPSTGNNNPLPNVPLPHHDNPNPKPTPIPTPPPSNPQPKPVEGRCNTGEMQCCNSVQKADSQQAAAILSTLGVALGSVTGMVGLTCSPISAIAISGNSCNAQVTCCDHNNFNGVVALGCNPINANL